MTRPPGYKLLLGLGIASCLWVVHGGAVDLDPSLYEKELPDPGSDRASSAGGRVIDDREPLPFGDEPTPVVTVKEHENRTVEEYRSNDNLYMVKVTPFHGKPYYLIDDDGSGDMEMRRNAEGMDNRVPQWTLFSW